MVDATTPIADNTAFGLLIGGKVYSFNLLNDTAGADAMGLVTTSPAANTLLGRLKAIDDRLAGATYYQTTQPVSLASAPLPTGAATAAKQDAIVTAIGSATYYPTVQPVSGTVGVSGSVAVTGTFYQATQPISAAALPLPAGAATATGVAAIVTALGSPLQAGGSVSVTASALPTGAATAANQSSLNTLVSSTTPADDVSAVTPSDSTDLTTIPKALLVTAAGTLAIKGSSGTTVSLGTVAAGTLLPIRARRVMATGTTATVVGLL